MKNFVHPGANVPVTAPYDVLSGAGCLVGILFGIAAFDALSGATVELATEGVFDVTALSTDTASGTSLVAAYWDNTNKRITTTSSGNTKVGVIVKAKTNGETTARVRLNATF